MGSCSSANANAATDKEEEKRLKNEQKEEEKRLKRERKEEEKRLKEERKEEEKRQKEESKKEEEAKKQEEKLQKEREEAEKRKQEEEKRQREEEDEQRRRIEAAKQEAIRRAEEEKQKEEQEKEQEQQEVGASEGLDLAYIEAALEEHNKYRAMHDAPPVTHSVELSNYAQKWANHLANSGQFAHSDCDMNGTRVGENLAMGYQPAGAEYPAIMAVKMWYDEIKDYEKYFGREPDMKDFMQFGHFTQVVWKRTSAIGIGKACKDGKTVIVGTYNPPGNLQGSFAANVSPVFLY